MAQFEINDADFASLKGQVIVVTGGSSGIGLATAELLLDTGALVVVGDRNAPPIQHANLTFHHTDVTHWPDLLALFDAAITQYSRVDHVFANAGIGVSARYLDSMTDPTTGALMEPSQQTYEVNLRGMINTAYLGMHHMRQQPSKAPGGSVVCTASASAFQRFGGTDYAVTKHGILGFVRGITAETEEKQVPIRINAVAPSWTISGIVTSKSAAGAGLPVQEPGVVARNVAVLMADETRRGQVVYSAEGKFYEVDNAVLLPAMKTFVGENSEEVGYYKLLAFWAEHMRKSGDSAEGEVAK